MDKKKNELIIQSNKVIEASYKLTLQEKRLICILLTKINIYDEDFKPYEFSVNEIAELLEIPTSNLYRDLMPITRDLMSKVLSIREKETLLQVNWFSSVEYLTGQGKMILEFSPKLKPYLLQLKNNFTMTQLNNIISLNSFYTVRIYELLKQYENIGEREIGILKLREILGIKDLKAYDIYNNFKQRILTSSVKEINEKSDLFIEFEERKQSRKVFSIIFKIYKKQTSGADAETSHRKTEDIHEDKIYNPETLELYNLLPEIEKIEMRKKELENLLKSHSYDYLKSDIIYCNRNKPKSYWPYFLKSVSDGHYSAAEKEKNKRAEKKKIDQEKNEEKLILKNKDIEIEIDKIIKDLTKIDKIEFEKFYDNLNSTVKKITSKETFLRTWIRDRYFQ